MVFASSSSSSNRRSSATQRVRFQSSNATTSSNQLPPPPLTPSSDDDDEEYCSHSENHDDYHQSNKIKSRQSNKKGKRKRHSRNRSCLEDLRLFWLTGRRSRCWMHACALGLTAALVFVVSNQVWHWMLAPTILLAIKDGRHILAAAGYHEKPTMMIMPFHGMASSSLADHIHALDPPTSHGEWLDLLHHHHGHHHNHYHHSDQEDDDLTWSGIRVEPMSDLEVQHHIRHDSEDYAHKPKTTPNPETCKPQYEWQTKSFPVCNSVHEHSMMPDRMFLQPDSALLDQNHPRNKLRRRLAKMQLLSQQQNSVLQQQSQHRQDSDDDDDEIMEPQYKLLAHGYWRDTWMLQEPSVSHQTKDHSHHNHYSTDKIAFKTMRYTHDFDEYVFDKQRRDSVTSDRLQSSQQAIHMFAHCGTSALYEFAPGGDLFQFLEQFDDGQDWIDTYPSAERIVLAYNVTSALADLHTTEQHSSLAKSFDKHGFPVTAIVHGDFNANQFVAVTPKDDINPETGVAKKIPHFKLGDFNLARFVYWNERHQHPCVVKPDGSGGEFRAPEEYAKEPGRTEKVDIYSLGNLLYSIITGHWPFDDYQDKHGRWNLDRVQKLVQDGVRPHLNIESDIEHSEDPYVQAMLKAMYMCWKQDPHERASARQVEEFLAQHLPPEFQAEPGIRAHHSHPQEQASTSKIAKHHSQNKNKKSNMRKSNVEKEQNRPQQSHGHQHSHERGQRAGSHHDEPLPKQEHHQQQLNQKNVKAPSLPLEHQEIQDLNNKDLPKQPESKRLRT